MSGTRRPRRAFAATLLLLAATRAASAQSSIFLAALSPDEVVPPIPSGVGTGLSTGAGSVTAFFDAATAELDVIAFFSGLETVATGAAVHVGAPGTAGPPLFTLTGVPSSTIGLVTPQTFVLGAADVASLFAGELYLAVASTEFPDGELRGQLRCVSTCPPPTTVPEPGTAALLGGGLAALTLLVGHRRRASAPAT